MLHPRAISLLPILVACHTQALPPMSEAPTPLEAGARASIGETAPAFVLPAIDGSLVHLSDFAGQTVVLEWFNPGCPFVKDVYSTEKMSELAGKWTPQGVTWLAINSGAVGTEGTGQSTNARAARGWDIEHPILLDETGAVGKAYGAKTTPHMYVIDPSGQLVFAGAFSNAPLGRIDGEREVNYVDEALEAVASGQPVSSAQPKAWGCSVKYGS